jgi:cysteinyl-tRNA synthetase
MVRDLLEEVPPDAVRLYLAAHHYRTPWSYDPEKLAQHVLQAQRWSAAATAKGGNGAPYRLPASIRADFSAALCDDLNTPEAIGVLDAAAHELHKATHHGYRVDSAQAEFTKLAEVLGLRLVAPIPAADVMTGWRRHIQEFEATDPACG